MHWPNALEHQVPAAENFHCMVIATIIIQLLQSQINGSKTIQKNNHQPASDFIVAVIQSKHFISFHSSSVHLNGKIASTKWCILDFYFPHVKMLHLNLYFVSLISSGNCLWVQLQSLFKHLNTKIPLKCAKNSVIVLLCFSCKLFIFTNSDFRTVSLRGLKFNSFHMSCMYAMLDNEVEDSTTKQYWSSEIISPLCTLFRSVSVVHNICHTQWSNCCAGAVFFYSFLFAPVKSLKAARSSVVSGRHVLNATIWGTD